MLPQVVPKLGTKCALVQDVFGVHLGQAERLLFLSGPAGGIETLAFCAGWPALAGVLAQDVEDCPFGETQGMGDASSTPAVLCVEGQHLLLYLQRGPPG